MKPHLLGWLYRSGVLPLWHRIRNRNTLTVVLFHRVLPDSGGAAPFSVTSPVFEQCLRFFRRHYNVVSPDAVLDALSGRAPLPSRALLITFDDGWKDNLEYALPALKRLGVPALLFAVAGLCRGRDIWQEPLISSWLAGKLSPETCGRLWRAAGVPGSAPSWDHVDSVHHLLAALEKLAPQQRDSLMHAECGALAGSWHSGPYLSPADLEDWVRQGQSLGAHGLTHHPLLFAPDPRAELAQAREILSPVSAAGGQAVETFAFPHGRYDGSLVRLAFECGYRAVFTSDAVTNRCRRGRPSALLGRVEPGMENATDSRGRFAPQRLANRLFRLPARRLACPE